MSSAVVRYVGRSMFEKNLNEIIIIWKKIYKTFKKF